MSQNALEVSNSKGFQSIVYFGVNEQCTMILTCKNYKLSKEEPQERTSIKPTSIVWNYFADLMVYMFVLAAAIKTADRVAKEMMGL